MSTNDITGLPKLIERYTDVPELSRHVYELTENGYELTEGGRQLRKVRQAIAEHRSVEFAPQEIWGKAPAEIGLPDWSRTMSAASTDERRDLLRLAAAGKIAIRR